MSIKEITICDCCKDQKDPKHLYNLWFRSVDKWPDGAGGPSEYSCQKLDFCDECLRLFKERIMEFLK